MSSVSPIRPSASRMTSSLLAAGMSPNRVDNSTTSRSNSSGPPVSDPLPSSGRPRHSGVWTYIALLRSNAEFQQTRSHLAHDLAHLGIRWVEGSRASAATPLDGKCQGLRLRWTSVDVAAVCIVVRTAGCRVESHRLLHFVLASAHEGDRAAHADGARRMACPFIVTGRCARDSRSSWIRPRLPSKARIRKAHRWGCPTGFRSVPQL